MLAKLAGPGRLLSRRAKALAGIAVLALALHVTLLGGAPSLRFGLPRPQAAAALQVRTIVPAPPGGITAAPARADAAAGPAAAPLPASRRAPASPQPVPPAPGPLAAATGNTSAVPIADAPEPAVAPTAAPAVAPLAGQGGDAPAQRTAVPASVTIGYTFQRGAQRGSGELKWNATAEAYTLQLDASVDGALLLAQESSGGFDIDGLAPLRFTDERARRDMLATNFQRDAGKITFSGPSTELPLVAGAQDRLSVLMQLAAVVAAEPATHQPGGAVSLFVVGVRADAAAWLFEFTGEETVQTGAGPVLALRFARAASGAFESRVDVWLDPARQMIPVRLRMANGPDDPGFDWVMERATLAAQP